MRNIVPDFEKWDGMSAAEIVKSLLGTEFTCPECGRKHSITVQQLEAKPGIMDEMADRCAAMGLKGQAMIVFDENTYDVAGGLVDAMKPFDPLPFVFPREGMHADQSHIGRLVIELQGRPDFLVACGSGNVTDTVRHVSYATGLPFVSFGTAASMDGYASGSTPMMIDGYKVTLPSKAPEGIFADPDIVATAPAKMTAAGFGDVLAKIIALLDWQLAYDVLDEPHCPLIARMVQKAVDECIAIADDLKNNDAAACGKLLEVLALSGMTMQLMGTTRPASGFEHQISHMFEMLDAQQHRAGALHGDKVGIGTLIAMHCYLELFEKGMPEQRPVMKAAQWESEIRRVYGAQAEEAFRKNPHEPPKGEEWDRQRRIIEQSMERYGYEKVRSFRKLLPEFRDMIQAIGGPIYPSELGYTKEETYDAIAFGKDVRFKFGVQRIAENYGWIYDLADEITQGLYDKSIY